MIIKQRTVYIFFFLIFIPGIVFGEMPTPIFEYKFNETGTYAESTGTDIMPLLLETIDGPKDLHSEGGLGVSGSLGDRAFDNTKALGMGTDSGQGYGRGRHEEVNTTLPGLKSYTFQGWFKTASNKPIQKAARLIQKTACFVIGAKYDPSGGTEGNITFLYSSASLGQVESGNVYLSTEEWIFFAITTDSTSTEDNIKFYMGTKEQPVRLVSVGTITKDYSRELYGNQLTIGAGAPPSGPIQAFHGYMDNIRIFGSKADNKGVLSVEQLEQLRVNDMTLVADIEKSVANITKSIIPADGTSETEILVYIKDRFETAIPRQKVILTKVAGDIEIGPLEAIAGDDGKASFFISSIESGSIMFEISIDPGYGLTPVVLEGKNIEVTLTETINKEFSEFKIYGDDCVSADGVSSYIAKMILRNYAQEPINGREVSLSSLSPNIVIIPQVTKKTGEGGEQPGEATFEIICNESFDDVVENIVATVEPDFGNDEFITFSKDISFVGRLLVEGDGSNYSKITGEERILALGLEDEDVEVGKVPTDGYSHWNYNIRLVDKNGAVRGRKIIITEDNEDDNLYLAPGDIKPVEVKTDINGEASFSVSTKKSEEITTRIKIQVLNDVNAVWYRTVSFLPDDFGVWVVDVFPKKGSEDAETESPIEVIFNNPIVLVDKETQMKLSWDSPDSPIIDMYFSGEDSNWSYDSSRLSWKHRRLELNKLYTVEIKGINDIYGNTMKPFMWTFKGSDSIPPYIVSVEPEPWAVHVEINPYVRIRFSEELVTNDLGQPEGLLLLVKDFSGNLLPEENITFQSYAPSTNEVVYLLSNLPDGASYYLTVHGARDFGNLDMEEYTWCFSVASLQIQKPRIIKVEVETDACGDLRINSPLSFYFNEKVRLSPLPKIVVKKKSNNSVVDANTRFISDSNGTGLIFNAECNDIFEYDTLYEVIFSNIASENGEELEDHAIEFLTEVATTQVVELDGREGPYYFLIEKDGYTAQVEMICSSKAAPLGTEITLRNLDVNMLNELNSKIYNSNLALTQYTFNLKTNIDSFIEPIKISIPYIDKDDRTDGSGRVVDLTGKLIPERSLKAFQWKEETQEWIPVNSVINASEDIVSFTTIDSGIFGLVGIIDVIAPSFLSKVTLTTNPLAPGSGGLRNETVFKFRLAYDSKITITIFDSSGKYISTLLAESVFREGYNAFAWDGLIDGRALSPGIYIYRLFATSLDPVHPDNAWYSGAIGIISR